MEDEEGITEGGEAAADAYFLTKVTVLETKNLTQGGVELDTG